MIIFYTDNVVSIFNENASVYYAIVTKLWKKKNWKKNRIQYQWVYCLNMQSHLLVGGVCGNRIAQLFSLSFVLYRTFLSCLCWCGFFFQVVSLNVSYFSHSTFHFGAFLSSSTFYYYFFHTNINLLPLYCTIIHPNVHSVRINECVLDNFCLIRSLT